MWRQNTQGYPLQGARAAWEGTVPEPWGIEHGPQDAARQGALRKELAPIGLAA